jgi:hypothetical protein
VAQCSAIINAAASRCDALMSAIPPITSTDAVCSLTANVAPAGPAAAAAQAPTQQ